MKKAISVILTLTMLAGVFCVTALAEEENQTTVTATVPAPEVTYTMVIPSSGAKMTETNHADGVVLGDVTSGNTTAGVTDVQNADVATKIYYTATLSAFSDGNDHTMEATYTYSQSSLSITDESLVSDETKVYVYDGTNTGSETADSTVKVKVSDTVWNEAEPGTYTATVTFNFGSERE